MSPTYVKAERGAVRCPNCRKAATTSYKESLMKSPKGGAALRILFYVCPHCATKFREVEKIGR